MILIAKKLISLIVFLLLFPNSSFAEVVADYYKTYYFARTPVKVLHIKEGVAYVVSQAQLEDPRKKRDGYAPKRNTFTVWKVSVARLTTEVSETRSVLTRLEDLVHWRFRAPTYSGNPLARYRVLQNEVSGGLVVPWLSPLRYEVPQYCLLALVGAQPPLNPKLRRGARKVLQFFTGWETP